MTSHTRDRCRPRDPAELADQRRPAGLGQALRRALRRDLQPHRCPITGVRYEPVTASRARPDRAASLCRGLVARLGTLMGYAAGWDSSPARLHHLRRAGAALLRLLLPGDHRDHRLCARFRHFLGARACAHHARAYPHRRADQPSAGPAALPDASPESGGAGGVHGVHRQGRLWPVDECCCSGAPISACCTPRCGFRKACGPSASSSSWF